MNGRAFAMALVALLGAQAVLAAPDPLELEAALEPIRAKHGLPALAGAIVTTRGLVAAATGVRKRGTTVKATAADQWHLGSDTKAMTAVLAARFVERGQLRWDSTLGEAFPDLAPRMQAPLRVANLLHLLSNRSGVAANLDWGRVAASAVGVRDQRVLAVTLAGSSPPAFTPGSGYLYSNLGFVVAGAMLERTARDSWEQLMKLHVFEPLGMRGCGFGGTGTPGQLDQPWGHLGDGRAVDRNGPDMDNRPVMGPAGTVHCTFEGWAAFVGDQLRGARGEAALLRTETYRRLHSPPFGGDYALGWIAVERGWAGGTALTHAGSNTMNYAVAWLAPRRGFAVLVATNQAGPQAERGADEAAGALIGLHQRGPR